MKSIEKYSMDWLIALYEHFIDSLTGDILENKEILYYAIKSNLYSIHCIPNPTDDMFVDEDKTSAKWRKGQLVIFDEYFNDPKLTEQKLISPDFHESIIKIGELHFSVDYYILMKTIFENDENPVKIYTCGIKHYMLFESGFNRGLLVDFRELPEEEKKEVSSKPIVKIHHSWQGMKCKVCGRFIKNKVECDLNGPVEEYNYCCLFYPVSKGIGKDKILKMWKDHTQRFIRERQE